MPEKRKIELEYEVYASKDELPLSDQALLKEAEKISETAYAPYSNFLVGAAIRTRQGTVITGSNQENIAYPSGLCAERTALFYLGAQHPHEEIEAIAVAARRREGVFDACSPCGSCRQAMVEYEDKQTSAIRFIMQSDAGRIIVLSSIASLMPLKFESLKEIRK